MESLSRACLAARTVSPRASVARREFEGDTGNRRHHHRCPADLHVGPMVELRHLDGVVRPTGHCGGDLRGRGDVPAYQGTDS